MQGEVINPKCLVELVFYPTKSIEWTGCILTWKHVWTHTRARFDEMEGRPWQGERVSAMILGSVPGEHKASLIDFIPPKISNFAFPLPGQDEQRHKIIEQIPVLQNMPI